MTHNTMFVTMDPLEISLGKESTKGVQHAVLVQKGLLAQTEDYVAGSLH